MKSKDTSRLITASEVARHLFCARALGYDWRYPQERDLSLTGHLKRWAVKPAVMAVVGLMVLFLSLLIGIEETLVAVIITILLLGGLYLVWQRARRSPNEVIFHNVKAKAVRKPLVAYEFGLVGKPDCLLDIEGYEIPVLMKHTPAPETPHDAHVTQIVAYCLLVAENRQKFPPYGIIRYQDGRTFEVEFDEDSVEVLSRIMDEIEINRRKDDQIPNRSHEDRRRCYACRHRPRCDQNLFV